MSAHSMVGGPYPGTRDGGVSAMDNVPPSAGTAPGAESPPPSPPPPPPGYGPGPAGVPWRPVPVHKPGVVALRPLNLGDLYDGAFKTIRRNPQAMIGLAAVVTTAFLVVPAVLTLMLAATGGLSFSYDVGDGGSDSALNVANLGALFGVAAAVLLNGMIVHVVAQAVLGRRTTMGQAWAAVRGRVWRLVALTALDVTMFVTLLGVPVGLGILLGVTAGLAAGLLVGIPLTLAGLALAVFWHFRYFLLAPAALVLERTSFVGALRRSALLSRRQWWRLFGIQLLTGLVVGVVGQVLTVPFLLLTLGGPFFLDPTAAGLVVVLGTYLSQVVVGTVTTPFTSGVTALQYVDQRIRKEGLDVELIAASQARRSDGVR